MKLGHTWLCNFRIFLHHFAIRTICLAISWNGAEASPDNSQFLVENFPVPTASIYYRDNNGPVSSTSLGISAQAPFYEVAKNIDRRMIRMLWIDNKLKEHKFIDYLAVFNNHLLFPSGSSEASPPSTSPIDMSHPLFSKSVAKDSANACAGQFQSICLTFDAINDKTSLYVWQLLSYKLVDPHIVYGILVSYSKLHARSCRLQIYLHPSLSPVRIAHLVAMIFLNRKHHVPGADFQFPVHTLVSLPLFVVSARATSSWRLEMSFYPPKDTLLDATNLEMAIDSVVNHSARFPSIEKIIKRTRHLLNSVCSANLILFGSFKMDGWISSSDCDLLCIIPFDIPFATFYNQIVTVFGSQTVYSDFMSIPSFNQIKFNYKFVKIDFLVAHYADNHVPPQLDFIRNPRLLHKIIDGQLGVKAHMNTETLLSMIPEGQHAIFSYCLRLLKGWAKRRCIYHGSMGYLSSISLAIKIIFVMKQTRTNILSLKDLIVDFFSIFSTWNWDNHIDIAGVASPADIRAAKRYPIKIFTVIPEPSCVTYSVTHTTLNIIRKEFARADQICKKLCHPDRFAVTDVIKKLTARVSFFDHYTHYLQFLFVVPNYHDYRQIVSLVEPKLRKLVKDIEKLQNISAIPYPHPFVVGISQTAEILKPQDLFRLHTVSDQDCADFYQQWSSNSYKVNHVTSSSTDDLVSFALYLGLDSVGNIDKLAPTLLRLTEAFSLMINQIQPLFKRPLCRILPQAMLPSYLFNPYLLLAPADQLYGHMNFIPFFELPNDHPILVGDLNFAPCLKSIIKLTCAPHIGSRLDPIFFCSVISQLMILEFRQYFISKLLTINDITNFPEILCKPQGNHMFTVLLFAKPDLSTEEAINSIKRIFTCSQMKMIFGIIVKPNQITIDQLLDKDFPAAWLQMNIDNLSEARKKCFPSNYTVPSLDPKDLSAPLEPLANGEGSKSLDLELVQLSKEIESLSLADEVKSGALGLDLAWLYKENESSIPDSNKSLDTASKDECQIDVDHIQ